jgi:hypothetical protein
VIFSLSLMKGYCLAVCGNFMVGGNTHVKMS